MAIKLTDCATDADGYLKDHHLWSTSLAKELAATESIELTQAHWEIITLVRELYSTYQQSPANRMLINAIKKKHGPEKGNSLYLMKLFPKGAARQATKIAGLPKPPRCI